VAANTWYAVYAVKTSDNTSHFVAVADTVLPVQASYSALNTNFGANSWVYLGLVKYGDNGNATTAILSFVQLGNHTVFTNLNTNPFTTCPGILLASTASASALTWAYAAGTGAAQIPSIVSVGDPYAQVNGASGGNLLNSAGTISYCSAVSNASVNGTLRAFAVNVLDGYQVNSVTGAATGMFISFAGFWDRVLGVGPNPLI
jgi:hypothetical protein